ncbi:MAG: sugar phosphate nucleotidyltransferase [Candidatus Nealsonbacteria bacterium]
MKALILAAGIGSRLRPITNEIPKCLTDVNGKTIIERQIDALLVNGLDEIFIVVGYKKEKVQSLLNEKYSAINIHLIDNLDYESTNNLYSFYLAKPFLLGHDFILMNGDVIFDAEILKDLLNSPHENIIPVEKGGFNEESMKIVVENDVVKDISKKITKNDAFGISIDVYKFSNQTSGKLFQKAKEIIFDQGQKNLWNEVVIQSILNEVEFYPLDIGSKYWIEIDNHKDLNMAKEIIKTKEI